MGSVVPLMLCGYYHVYPITLRRERHCEPRTTREPPSTQIIREGRVEKTMREGIKYMDATHCLRYTFRARRRTFRENSSACLIQVEVLLKHLHEQGTSSLALDGDKRRLLFHELRWRFPEPDAVLFARRQGRKGERQIESQ